MAISSIGGGGDGEDEDIVAEINITPLTDIFLVLLIIFMVTTSVVQNQGKNVDLPSAAVAAKTPEGVIVTVTDSGEIQVGESLVQEDQLLPALALALEEARDKVVVLKGDRKVMLGKAVNILDLAQQAGATGIAIATQAPPKGEPESGEFDGSATPSE